MSEEPETFQEAVDLLEKGMEYIDAYGGPGEKARVGKTLAQYRWIEVDK